MQAALYFRDGSVEVLTLRGEKPSQFVEFDKSGTRVLLRLEIFEYRDEQMKFYLYREVARDSSHGVDDSGDWTLKKKVGDRVTRPLFMDDGTWNREGDDCLDRSPLRHGVVVSVYLKKSCYGGIDELIDVKWDSGETRTYFHSGVDFEKAEEK